MSTPMTDAEKKWIDEASYFQLLKMWRFQPTGTANAIFSGESGVYFANVMKKMREVVGPAEHTRVSKAIGWN